MPIITWFNGIILRMLFMDTQQHPLPHLYLEYQGMHAVISIPDGNLLGGDFPANEVGFGSGVDSYPRRGVDGGLDAGSEWRTCISN